VVTSKVFGKHMSTPLIVVACAVTSAQLSDKGVYAQYVVTCGWGQAYVLG